MLRGVVNARERVSQFFANDLQNIYYKYLFKRLIGEKTQDKSKAISKAYVDSAKEYWKPLCNLDVRFHAMYANITGTEDPRFVADYLWFSKIEPALNRKTFSPPLEDKAYYFDLFPEASMPATIVSRIEGIYYNGRREIIALDDAVRLCLEEDEFVVKLSIGSGAGYGVSFVRSADENEVNLKARFDEIAEDFTVQEIIVQAPEMEAFNRSSVNSLRIITYLRETGVEVLSVLMKMGSEGSRLDNAYSGGIACGVDGSGRCKHIAYDDHWNAYSVHPNGFQFSGKAIPSFERCVGMAKRLATRLGHFRVVSWDIAVGANYEPILIEFNAFTQSIDYHQLNNGPLFGEFTDEVIGLVGLRTSGKI